MNTNWSPQVARTMHELSNAAPTPPTAGDLEDGRLRPHAGKPSWVTPAAVALVVAAVVGLVAFVGHTGRSPVTGPATLGTVRHNRYHVIVTAQLACDHPIDTLPNVAPFTVDTWSDREGRRWKTTITFADGQVMDEVLNGSAVYPTADHRRGDRRIVQVGCTVSGDLLSILATDMLSAPFFSLDLSPELVDERPYVELYTDLATEVPGEHHDSSGRPCQLWQQQVDGFIGARDKADHAVRQTQQWCVDPSDGHTVRERQFASTVDGLGTAIATGTLVSSEIIELRSSMFDTTGYAPQPTFPRPTLPQPAPTGSSPVPQPPTTTEPQPGSASTSTAVATAQQHPELVELAKRTWRIVAFGAVGAEQQVSSDWTNTLAFQLGTNGNGTMTTHGCLVETLAITFKNDNTFVLGAPVGTQATCANPLDEGQHVADVFSEGGTVRWAIGDDGRLTLAPAGDTNTDALYA